MPNKKISIVWNPSRKCVWDCAFCCLNAVSEKKKGEIQKIPELSFEEKRQFIDQLTPGRFNLDFGGGEILSNPEHLDLILYASERIGADSIGVSKTGVNLTDSVIEKLKGKIHDIELSLDVAPSQPYDLRPDGYHSSAAVGMVKLKAAGFYVGAQTVLTRRNISEKTIDALFAWLDKNNIDKWSLLRLFPSGRGKTFQDITPSYDEYCRTVDYIKKISAGSGVYVHFQYLLPGHEGYTTDCRAVKRSVGVLHNGFVSGCFWDLDEEMHPTKNRYVLGRVPQENIEDILANSKSRYWLDGEHKCEIFER